MKTKVRKRKKKEDKNSRKENKLKKKKVAEADMEIGLVLHGEFRDVTLTLFHELWKKL